MGWSCTVYKMAGVGHSCDRVTLLPLLYCIYILLYANTCTQAQEAHTQADNASTAGSDTRDQYANTLTQSLSWALDLCPDNTCRNRCGSHFLDCTDRVMGAACNCDKRCRLFNDCCPDFSEACIDVATEAFNETYLQKHHHYMSYIDHHVHQADSEIKKIKWIQRCPKWANKTTAQKCEKPNSLSTTTYLQYAPAMYDGFIFRNQYCAMCHGSVDSPVLIGFYLSCREKRSEAELRTAFAFNDLDKLFQLAGKYCLIEYKFSTMHGKTARFLTYENDTNWNKCPSQTSKEFQSLQHSDAARICESYQSMILTGKELPLKIFNNPHCALCNGIPFKDIIDYAYCWKPMCHGPYQPVLKSFGILVDVGSSVNKDLGETIASYEFCPFGHILDVLKMACTPTICKLGLIANGSSCVRAFEPVGQVFNRSKEVYTIVYTSRVSPSLDIMKMIDNIKSHDDIAELMFLYQDTNCVTLPLKARAALQGASMNLTNYVCLIIKVHLQRDIDAYFLQNLRSMYHDRDALLQMFIFNYDISVPVECKEGKGIYSQDAVLYKTPIQQNVFLRDVGYTWPGVNVPVMIYQDYKESGTYQLLVKACVKDWKVRDDDHKDNNIKEIVTLIGNVVSLLALFFTLVTFCILPSLKSIVRILLINLIIALFMSQSTFVLESFLEVNTVTCRAVGIFQHYSWLAYFFLMNSTAAKMAWGFRSFAAMVATRTAGVKRRHLVGLLLYGWMSPLFLVTPSLILDIMNHHILSPRYGREAGCWFNNQSALLYFFVIPFSVIVIFNTILILFTVIKIRTTATHRHMLPHELDFFQINLRLSTLMGLSWLLGIVASYTNLEALWYTFIVVNTLQGLILLFSFGHPLRTLRHLFRRETN